MSQPLFKADRVTVAFAAQKGGSWSPRDHPIPG